MGLPDAPVRLHSIRNDQLYHYYLADPLEVFMLNADGSTDRVIVGPDVCNVHHLQLLIPGHTFHTARLFGHGRWFLGASTEWPAVIPADVEIGNLDLLAVNYPAVATELRQSKQRHLKAFFEAYNRSSTAIDVATALWARPLAACSAGVKIGRRSGDKFRS
jgi:hypothetical protein